MSFLSWKLFLASFTNDKKLSTIYKAEKSYDFVFKHEVDIYRLSSNQGNGFLFFSFLYDWKNVYSPFDSRLEVLEGSRKSLTIRQKSLICLYSCSVPKFDTSRHLHVSVCVFPKNLSSLKKNPWRKLRNYLASISTRAPSAPMCLRLPFWRPSYFTCRGQLPPLPPPASTPLLLWLLFRLQSPTTQHTGPMLSG